MIQIVRNIPSENPALEIWKHLRLFLNTARTEKAIRRIHSVKQGSQDQNVRKQAKQISYCLRQAEQYFRASEAVGLATKPLLLYYGCVSLSQALVLLRKDGSHSLDSLRKIENHRHHGLILNRGKIEKAKSATGAADFFSLLECSCFCKPDGTVWGHFPLFFQALQPSVFIIPTKSSDFGAPTLLESEMAMICADLPPIDRLSQRKLNAFELLKDLPDLYQDLGQLAIRPHLAPGRARRTVVVYHYKPAALTQVSNTPIQPMLDPQKELLKVDDLHEFFINGLTMDEKTAMLKFLTAENSKIAVVAQHPNNIYLTIRVESANATGSETGYYPDVVDDISGKLFYILNPADYLHEAAALIAILFCLGMLSRYYPDVWMAIIDRNVDVVEITNALMTIIARKFPNLILDQMTEVKHFIHL